MSMPEAAARELSFAQAVRGALAEEMRGDAPFRCATFTIFARLVQSCARTESRSTVYALRCERLAEDGHPRRESGGFFRRQDDASQAKRAGTVGGIYNPFRRSGC